jgi:hypothetical protein
MRMGERNLASTPVLVALNGERIADVPGGAVEPHRSNDRETSVGDRPRPHLRLVVTAKPPRRFWIDRDWTFDDAS